MRALIYVIDTLSMLITFVFLLRFWLPWFGADFRNPIAQGLLQATSPVINPLRRIVPSIGRVDTATILVMFLIQAATILLITALSKGTLSPRAVVIFSLFKLVQLSLQLFMFAIIVRIILGWIAPQTHNPATALPGNITEPLLRPFRRFIPPMGGFDISPIFAIITLGALGILLQDTIPLLM